MVWHLKGPGGDDLAVVGNRIKLASGDGPPAAPALLGQHTEEVLRDLLGYDGPRIEELRREGVI